MLLCLQVHHGGAGTTAAGLKAAVMAKIEVKYICSAFYVDTLV